MKKINIFFHMVMFVCICAVVLSAVSWVFRSNDVIGRYSIRGIRNEEGLDAVFIGPSTIVDYYEPLLAFDETGIASYNYTGVGIRANLTDSYIKDILKTQSPKVFVVDLTTFENKGSELDESGLRNWSDSLPLFSLNRINGLTNYLSSHDIEGVDTASYYLDIIRYHTLYENLGDPGNWSFLSPSDIHGSHKGFEPLVAHIASEVPVIDDNRLPESEIRMDDLNRILDYCDKKDLDVLFTFSPKYEQRWERNNTIRDVINERGYETLDLNRYIDEIGMNFETDMANDGHVNIYGADKYTRFMAKYLVENYDLSDHRGDPAYSDWQDEAISYRDTAYVWRLSMENTVRKDFKDKAIGEELKNIGDFEKWYMSVSGSGLDVIIAKPEGSDIGEISDAVMLNFFERYGIGKDSNDGYIGIYRGNDMLYSSDRETEYMGRIGRSNGYSDIRISVEGDAGIEIGGENVFSFSSANSIGILVYDECYRCIRDRVIINTDSNGNMDFAHM